MPVYLSLGSNIGNRLQHLRSAVEALRAELDVTVLRESRVYETDPVGDTDQPAFLNMAVAIETGLEPEDLLDRLQLIETELGRTATRRWGPRAIDIDIVLWDDSIIKTDRLTVPHPEFRKRAFVLIPLAEIAPLAVAPETGEEVLMLFRRLPDDSGVWLYGLPRA
jgi:2-amino-4-hydroxy-6-hydroxymethyldihydropteridine diphosphokinase